MPKIPKRKETHYKLKVIGKSGLFNMGNEIDVEYLQTTLSIEQLKEIEPVRRVFKRGTLPFDLMMQRELDDERIVNDLIPYLIENELAFFPPITVVILETDRTNTETPIKKLYPKIKINNDFDDGSETIYQKREYGDLFSINILKDEDELQRWFTELTVGPNATLLAIDGQHRLVALQTILNKLPKDEESIYNNLDEELSEKIKNKDFSNLSIPITFIFVPKLYQGNNFGIDLVAGFRKIFVDINRNARKVNEMRNILLDEQDLRAIFTRKLCSKIQEQGIISNSISIDEVEWEKTSRENQLTNPLAVTNVLFLRDIFKEWLIEGKDGTSIKSVMGLDKFSAELDGDKNFTYEDLDVESFSFHQKDFVIKLFNDKYLNEFYLLINSMPYILDRSNIIDSIRKNLNYEISKATTGSSLELLNKIKDVLFDGEEKNIHLKDKAVKLGVDERIKPLSEFQRDKGLDLLRTKLFQIAYFKVVFDLYNDKFIKVMEIFKNNSNFIFDISKERFYLKLWEKVFVSNKSTIDKGLKGHRGYSASNPLIETLSNLIFLFILKNLKDNVEFNLSDEEIELRRDKAKVRVENSFKNKYEIDLSKVYDDEKDISIYSKEFEKEVKRFLKIFD